MAKNNPQQSIFDEEDLLQSVIDNLKVLQERIRNNPEAALTEEEKGFVMGLGNGTQFTKPIVDSSKLEGKKVSPFAKMVMTVATTFSNAKKAFKRFNEEVAENTSNKVSQVKASAVKIGEGVDSSVGIASLGIKEALTGAVETMNTSKNSFAAKTSTAFRQKVDGVTEGMASKIDGISSRFDDKMENGKSRFLEIYDDITLQALGVRKSAISVVDTVRAGIKAGTSKVKPFVDLFEEPWIKVSFRGDKGLDVEKISYNTGLAMGKVANKMRGFLSDVVEQMEEVKTIKANRTSEARAGRSVAEAPVAEAPVVEASVAEAPVAEATGFVNETPSVEVPTTRKRFGATIGSAGVTELAQPAMVMQDTAGPQNTEAVASVIGAAPSNVSQEASEIKTNIPGENMEKVKKPSLLKRLANVFKIEFVATEYQKGLESGSLPEKISKNVDFNGLNLISSFTRKPNGALPEPSEIFERTEKMIMEKTGIAVNDQGYYYFPKTDFNENGEVLSKNKKMEILINKVQPVFIEIAKEGLNFLQDVNSRVKNDPQLKRFNEFADTVGGTKAALNLLEQAKLSDKGAEALGYLNMKDLGSLYNAYAKDPMKFQESHYLLEAAALNLKTIMSAGAALNGEIFMMKESNPEAKMFSDKFENEVLIDGFKSKNGVAVRVSDIISKTAQMDFSSVVKQKGNESIVFRQSHNVLTINKSSEESLQIYRDAMKKKAEQRYGIKEGDVSSGDKSPRRASGGVINEEDIPVDSRKLHSSDDVSMAVKVAHDNAYNYDRTNYLNHVRTEGYMGAADNINITARYVPPAYIPNPQSVENTVCNAVEPKTPMGLGSAPQPADHLPDMPATKPVLEVNQAAIDETRAASAGKETPKITSSVGNRFGKR